MPRHTITNFSRGEFAPQLYGRVDVPQYNAGAKELTNFIIQRYGGVQFRPGFRFVGLADDFGTVEQVHRYLPFQFSIDQAYVIDLEGSHMRLLAQGGYVTEDDLEIEAVTPGVTTIVKASYHGLNAGSFDRIYIDGVTGMVELNGQSATVIGVPDIHHLELDINSTSYTTFTGSTGIIRPAPPTPPPPPPTPPAPQPPPPPPPVTTSPNPPAEIDKGTGTYYPTGPHSPLTKIP